VITEKEFKERFGSEPKQDDLYRVNCDKAGEVGHLMCGVCSQCGQPRYVCGERCWRLRQLGLERVGNELFALPDEKSPIPKILVFKPTDVLRLGVNADQNTVFIVRERALSDTAYLVIVDDSDLKGYLYQPLNSEAIHMIRARINNCITAAVCSGDLFKDLTGKWRHSAEYWFGCRQSAD